VNTALEGFRTSAAGKYGEDSRGGGDTSQSTRQLRSCRRAAAHLRDGPVWGDINVREERERRALRQRPFSEVIE